MITLVDGPMGSELSRRGVPTPAPLWSALALTHAPHVVQAIHRDYAAAGATVHTANTFRARRRTMGPGWEGLARRAVTLARQSIPRGQRVAGSVAPVEDCYRPDLSPGASSRGEHAELARVLADAGVDVILCETFPAATEAAVAVEEAARTGVETWAALTAGPDATLLTPARMYDAARSCVDAGATAVLVNCTPATATLPYLEAIARACPRVGAYANAGAALDGIGWQEHAPTPEDPGVARYADLARLWIEAGATIVGGCCGTGPAHIAALGRWLARGGAAAG